MIRVAFTPIGGKNWTGGHNYLLNLLQALGRHQGHIIQSVLFVAADVNEEADSFATIPGVEIVRCEALMLHHRGMQLAQALLSGRVPALESLWAQHRIDVVFEAAQFFGWRASLPAIAWIPDFQHRLLPHLFSRAAWIKRELGFRAQIVGGRDIMLSSEDARRACEDFYPATRGRTRTVHFAVPPGELISQESARKVADSYGLPRDFIFMPNQFWQHKNHMLVLDALSILKSRGKQVVIAASGKQYDPRSPNHFQSFKASLDQRGLASSLRLLGLIPYADLSALLTCCQALLNPSLFEGWSTTVEEARALGTPMLLSDLEVHFEQVGDQAHYFKRNSAENLAELLASTPSFDAVSRAQAAKTAQGDAEVRVAKFAQNFSNLAQVISGKGSGKLLTTSETREPLL